MIGLLFSGGLDSTAAMHLYRGRGRIVAVGFRYGQPHADAEIFAAQTIAARRGVPFHSLLLPELRPLNPTAGRDAAGLSRAFVPGRNALLLVRAAAALAEPGEPLRLVIGANFDDAFGFPDCRPQFFDAFGPALASAFVGFTEVRIETPWLWMSKAEILRWCERRPEALQDARDSMSCYRGTRCGECDPCVLRARAFADVGIEDGTMLPVFHGGDPHREAR